MNIRVTEIFLSLQGESRSVGIPTVFVRLTGCPLRCQYCDTAYAFYGGETKSIDAVLEEVATFGVRHVTVTGGEPLAQKNCPALLSRLCDADYKVSLETGGAMTLEAVDVRVSRVMDIKTPGSAEAAKNCYENIPHLTAHDQIKFVICDRADYEWAKQMVAEQRLNERCEILFSPSAAQLPARELADWILADRLPVRFQIQLHKYLWGDERGR